MGCKFSLSLPAAGPDPAFGNLANEDQLAAAGPPMAIRVAAAARCWTDWR